MSEDAKWERIVEDLDHGVRRLVVPTGWIYQTQTGRTYSTVSGTIGRERARGEPKWGPLVFVPLASSGG